MGQIKPGMKFIHKSWLTEQYQPLVCVVTAVRKGRVYWKGTDSKDRWALYFYEEDAPKYVKEWVNPIMKKNPPRSASWVIVDKKTGKPVFETFSKATADKVNEDKYRVVPIMEYLTSLNRKNPPRKSGNGYSIYDTRTHSFIPVEGKKISIPGWTGFDLFYHEPLYKSMLSAPYFVLSERKSGGAIAVANTLPELKSTAMHIMKQYGKKKIKERIDFEVEQQQLRGVER